VEGFLYSRRFSLQAGFPDSEGFLYSAGFLAAAAFLYSGKFPLQDQLERFLSDRSNVSLRKISKHKLLLRLNPTRLITSAHPAFVWHVFVADLVCQRRLDLDY
jgi:hypothetical protein